MSQQHGQVFNKRLQRRNKQQAVLDEAAMLFNEQGYSSTTLDDLASRLKLTKSALYYYVKSKEDLGLQSYRRTLQVQLGNLKAADAAGVTGLEKVVAYLRSVCDSNNPPSAILNEVAALNAEAQEELIAGSRDNAHWLRKFVATGVTDGSIAPCDPVLVALAINGLLSWVPQWFSRRESPIEAIGEAFVDILVDGLRPDGAAQISCEIPAELTLQKAPHEIFDRKQQARLKREALLKAATESFNQKGVAGTSLDAVVKSLNVTKGAFYYYVSSKDDLLYQCCERTLDMVQNVLSRADEIGNSGWEKLELAGRAIIDLHCGADGPIAMFSGVTALSAERKEEVSKRVTTVYETTTRFIHEGFADNSIRHCDPMPTFGVLVGSTIWLPKWYSPEGLRNGRQIADAFYSLFAHGLRSRPARELV